GAPAPSRRRRRSALSGGRGRGRTARRRRLLWSSGGREPLAIRHQGSVTLLVGSCSHFITKIPPVAAATSASRNSASRDRPLRGRSLFFLVRPSVISAGWSGSALVRVCAGGNQPPGR